MHVYMVEYCIRLAINPTGCSVDLKNQETSQRTMPPSKNKQYEVQSTYLTTLQVT